MGHNIKTMNRFILGIGAFILTFGFSFSLVGVLFGFPKLNLSHSHGARSESAKIQSVLDRDIYFGEKRRNDELRLALENRSKGISLAESQRSAEFVGIVDTYVASASSIRVDGTPADFAYAWTKHMAAWNAHLRLLKSADRSESGTRSLDENSDEISATYYQVLRIAKRYGVPMRQRYYR